MCDVQERGLQTGNTVLTNLGALAQIAAMPLFAFLALIAGFAASLLIFVMLLRFKFGSPSFAVWSTAALVVAIVNTLGAVHAIDQPSLAALGRYGLLSALVLAGFAFVWPG